MLRHTQTTLNGTDSPRRRGAFMVLAFFSLIGTLMFVAFSIDTGNIALNKTIMQNAVDSAALAAAMEITHAVENAPPGEPDPTAYAREQAKTVAMDTAALNGVFVDPNIDVEFGLRSFDPASQKFVVQWGVSPANAVKVKARRDNDDTTQLDGKLPMFFAGILGDNKVAMGAEAIAYIEARDIGVVLDFSGSMRYDSLLRSDTIDRLGADSIKDNLAQMYFEFIDDDGWAEGNNPYLGSNIDTTMVAGNFQFLGRLDVEDPFRNYNANNNLRTATPKYLRRRSSEINDLRMYAEFRYDTVSAWCTENGSQTSDLTWARIEYTDGSRDTWSNPSGTTENGQPVTLLHDEDKDIKKVWMRTTWPAGPVTIEGSLNGGGPGVTIETNTNRTQADVEIDNNDLEKIQVWWVGGGQQTFNNLNGLTHTVSAPSGKSIDRMKIWDDDNHYKFADVFERTCAFTDDNNQVKKYLRVDDNYRSYYADFPYDHTGSWSVETWDDYIDYCREDSDIIRGGLREMYGGVTFMHYMLENRTGRTKTPEIARTSHFPFHAVRKGNELFVNFLEDLGFGDHVGLVSYDQYRRVETGVNVSGLMPANINLTADPVDDHYQAVKDILRHRSSRFWSGMTNIGGGLRECKQMLDTHGREGARPTILLMTDGNANQYEDANGSLNTGSYWNESFDWGELMEGSEIPGFQITGSGNTFKSRMFAMKMAKKAADEGITVHTLAVGSGADRDLMRAIAWVGGGEFISVTGDLSVEAMLEEVEAGFYRIAALVPPARLADPDELSP